MSIVRPIAPFEATASSQPSDAEALIMLGMPHLSLLGLSESWLLKEMGHRHWMLIAQKAGRTVPDFRDAAGGTVYAAFCAVSIREAGLGLLAEHDALSISSEIARVSHTQFASTHRLSHGGAARGTVELSSVFVLRQQAGRNRSIARVTVDGFPPQPLQPAFARATDLAQRFRADRWREHFGFTPHDDEGFAPLRIRPNPSQHFNGAGFLYFASFPAFVDEAEWALFGPEYPRLTTVDRDVVYYGNIEVGESLSVTMRATRRTGDRLAHWCRLTRDADGARLADVFTERAIVA